MIIQSAYRCWRKRNEFLRASCSAIVIQSVWRKFSARLNYNIDLTNIIISQSLARVFLASNEVKRRIDANILIQCAARRWLARRILLTQKKHFEHLCRLNESAMICQVNYSPRRYRTVRLIKCVFNFFLIDFSFFV